VQKRTRAASPAKADKPAAKTGKGDAAAGAKGAEREERRRKEAKVAKAKAAKGAPAESSGPAKAPPKDYVVRMKALYDKEIVPNWSRSSATRTAPGAQDREDRAQHGRWRSGQRHKKVSARRRLALIAARGRSSRARARRFSTFKGAREHADRRQGDFAQDSHVRVSRSSGGRSRCRACATSAVSTRNPSTVAAITRSG